MAFEVFTSEWGERWCQAMNENQRYREAAKRWEGDVALVMEPDAAMGIEKARAVVADLWHGECRGVRAIEADELANVAYVISATASVWKQVLSGEVDPIVGLLGGKLKLKKGSMFSLLPYAKAAKEMVESARSFESRFPKDE